MQGKLAVPKKCMDVRSTHRPCKEFLPPVPSEEGPLPYPAEGYKRRGLSTS